MMKHDVTKTQFSETFLDRFFRFFVADIKLMLGKVLI